jgi:SH3 domain-containing protein
MRGWIFLPFLFAVCAEAVALGDAGYLPKAVDLLDAPVENAKVVAKLARKQSAEVLARSGSWTRIRAGNASGWVKTIELRLNSPVQTAKPVVPRVKSSSHSGVRGFSEDDLLSGSSTPVAMDQLKHLGISAKDATTFARSAGLKARKRDYFEGTDYMVLDFPDDFFDE